MLNYLDFISIELCMVYNKVNTSHQDYFLKHLIIDIYLPCWFLIGWWEVIWIQYLFLTAKMILFHMCPSCRDFCIFLYYIWRGRGVYIRYLYFFQFTKSCFEYWPNDVHFFFLLTKENAPIYTGVTYNGYLETRTQNYVINYFIPFSKT